MYKDVRWSELFDFCNFARPDLRFVSMVLGRIRTMAYNCNKLVKHFSGYMGMEGDLEVISRDGSRINQYLVPH